MKEESKYYTPNISEFHVGFEYEEWDVRAEDSYAKLVVREGQKLFMHDYCEYRVKYLDREDIESLGFEQISLNAYRKRADDIIHLVGGEGSYIILNMNISNGTTRKGNFYIGLRANTGELHGDVKTERCLFSGTIKNKSELKRILKQIGI
jgi:hypothetical protein